MKKFFSRLLYKRKQSKKQISPEMQKFRQYWEKLLSGDTIQLPDLSILSDQHQETKREIEELHLRLNEIEKKLSIVLFDTIELRR